MRAVALDGHTLNPGDLSWEAIGEMCKLVVYDRCTEEQAVRRSRGMDIILTNKTPIPSHMIKDLPGLKFIAVTATGYDMVDIAAAGRRGIPVSNVPEYGTDSVAQFSFALLLELCHRVGLHAEAVKAGEWTRTPDWSFWKTPQILLAGKKLGVIGFGRIGRRVGELANAFSMAVLAYDPYPAAPPAYSPFAWESLPDLFSEADMITVHCAQTADNVGFINRNLFDRMKKTAFFINASRGGLVNEADLAEVLKERRIAGAAADVVSVEPIRSDNPLLGAPNCLITPHIAWASLTSRRKLMASTVENVRAFLKGSPTNVVNSEYLCGDLEVNG